MDIRPIKTEADYQAALAEIERLMDAELGSPEGDRLDVLATLVEAYEEKHWPIDMPEPIEAIKLTMLRKGYSQADLAEVIGSRSRASEILNRKRYLTVEMIWALNKQWGIPAEALIKPYELARNHS
jgi:HTH-type transcriptional regulator/antitoxin HigA